jgi:hypothetical protein
MKISLDAAMRARDVSRPAADDEADAEHIPSAPLARPEPPGNSAEDRAARTGRPGGLGKPGGPGKPARSDPASVRPGRPDAASGEGQADPGVDRQARKRASRAARTAARHRGRMSQRLAGPPDPELAREAGAGLMPPDEAAAESAPRGDPGGRPPETAPRGDPGGRPPETAPRGDPGGRPPETAQDRPGRKPGRAGRPRRRRRSRLGLLAGHDRSGPDQGGGRAPGLGPPDARATGSVPAAKPDQDDPGRGGSSPVRS